MDEFKNIFNHNIIEHLRAIRELESIYPEILLAADSITKVIENGNKLLIFGNGGSAADAQHFAAELVGRFLKDRKALPAIALTTDTSAITAIANDFGYDQIFKRQIEALAKPGDVLFGISTSGNSANIIEALNAVSSEMQDMIKIGLTGNSGGKMANLCDILINVPSEKTPVIQECHVFIYHFICEIIEKSLF